MDSVAMNQHYHASKEVGRTGFVHFVRTTDDPMILWPNKGWHAVVFHLGTKSKRRVFEIYVRGKKLHCVQSLTG